MSTASDEAAWEALEDWVDALPPEVRRRAQAVAEEKASRHLTQLGEWEWAALVTAGKVYEVGLTWRLGRWELVCSCGAAARPCLHAAAVAWAVYAPWKEKQRARFRLPARPTLLGGEWKAPPGPRTVIMRTRLEIEEDGIDWFDLRAVRHVEDTTLTALELKTLLDAEGAWVDLGAKGPHRLVDATDADTVACLTEAGLWPRGFASSPRRCHVLQLARNNLCALLPEDVQRQLKRRAEELEQLAPPEIPKGFRAELRPYQMEGFRFLCTLSQTGCGAVLADDMGLGKTVQTLAWLAWLRERHAQRGEKGSAAALVVCPKSLMDNWRQEASKFVPGLHVRIWKSRDLRLFAHEAPWAGLNILSYPQLRQVAEKAVKTPFLAVILDEAQAVKNPDSATSRAARALQATHRLALTGTPIENRFLDLWSIMAFAVPGALGSRVVFEREIESLEAPDAGAQLARQVRPFILRRTKSQVARDLPERIEKDLYCEMEEAQRTLYRAELKKAQQHLLLVENERQFQQERFHVLASLMRLRQICCDPALVYPGTRIGSAKLEALDELLQPLLDEGHKVLIFSQFTTMLARLEARLQQHGAPVFCLTGSTERRGEVVTAFNRHAGPALFLISLKAGGAGLNLTSASYVVLFDPWWNPAVEAQAIDRAHRIGQTRTVIAYRLLIKDSLEEKIRALQAAKAALAEGVLGEESFTRSLSLAEWRSLLRDT